MGPRGDWLRRGRAVRSPLAPARLTLLVRGEAEQFELREVPSALARLHLCPRRPPAEEWEVAEVASRVDGQRRFVLKHRQTERFLLLSEPERFLWERMDGAASLQDLATAYVLRYGAFDFEVLPALVRKLQAAGLLTLTPASALRRLLARRDRRSLAGLLDAALRVLEGIHLGSRRVHPWFARLYRVGGFLLFTRGALAVSLTLGAAGLAAALPLWRQADLVARGLGSHPVAAAVGVKLLLVATLALHQGVHGLACVHYGRRVREFGFTFLHGFVPTFYVDVTDIFMASRRARVVTALAGPVVHLVLGAVGLVVAWSLPPGFLQAFVATAAVLQWQALVVALYPFCFLEMDGYHVVVDLLGLPTLRHDAVRYAGSLLRGRPTAPWGRQTALWLGYVVVSAISLGGFLAFNVWMILRAAG